MRAASPPGTLTLAPGADDDGQRNALSRKCVAKLIERDPDLLILVVSALADKLTAIEALEKGARGFLCKPFTDRQLNDALQMLINSKEQKS